MTARPAVGLAGRAAVRGRCGDGAGPAARRTMNPPVVDWRGRRAWIVGASSGIGAALARELLARGARVALSARRAGPLRQLAAEGEALVLALDATDPAAPAAALARIVAEWGGLDAVAFVAGTYRPLRAWDLTPAAIRPMVATNLVAVMDGVAAVLPQLLVQGAGAIVVVSSVAGYRGLPRATVYGPTKAALINFAETLYLDLRPRGIGVHLVDPGFVATPLTAGNDFRMPALITAAEAAREILAGMAAGRFEIHFPRRFTRWLKLARLLPYRWYFPLIRRLTGA